MRSAFGFMSGAAIAAAAPYTPLGFDVSTWTGAGTIDKTGAADSTTGIQNCLNANAQCYFPAGTYTISSPITVNTSNELYGDAPTTSIFNYTGTSGSGRFTGVFVGSPSNTIFSHLGFKAPSPTDRSAVSFPNATNCTMSYLEIDKLSIMACNSAQANWQVNGGHKLDHINARGGSGNTVFVQAGTNSSRSAIDLLYLTTFNVDYCTADSYYGLLQGWGGDSTVAGNNVYPMPTHPCTGITVNHSSSRNNGGAPGLLGGKQGWASCFVFCSMVDNVQVLNSTCYDSHDVGIDNEGGNNWLVDNCDVYGCFNGGLSCFNTIDNTTFSNNRVTGCNARGGGSGSGDAPGLLFRNYGNGNGSSESGNSAKCGTVKILNNTFNNATTGEAYLSRIQSSHALRNYIITGNTFNDCVIQEMSDWGSATRYKVLNTINFSNNMFNFTKVIGDSYSRNAIETGNVDTMIFGAPTPSITISGNTFNSTVMQSAFAIRTESQETGGTAHTGTYANNTYSSNFPNQNRLVWGGTNSAVFATSNITGSAGHISFTRDETSCGTYGGGTHASTHNQIITVNGVTQP